MGKLSSLTLGSSVLQNSVLGTGTYIWVVFMYFRC